MVNWASAPLSIHAAINAPNSSCCGAACASARLHAQPTRNVRHVFVNLHERSTAVVPRILDLLAYLRERLPCQPSHAAHVPERMSGQLKARSCGAVAGRAAQTSCARHRVRGQHTGMRCKSFLGWGARQPDGN